MAEETVNVNPDGSTTFEGSAGETFSEGAGETFSEGAEGDFIPEAEEVVAAGGDPAIYLLLVVVLLGILYFVFKRKSREDEDDFFSKVDGEKVRSKTPLKIVRIDSCFCLVLLTFCVCVCVDSSILNFLKKLTNTTPSRKNVSLLDGIQVL